MVKMKHPPYPPDVKNCINFETGDLDIMAWDRKEPADMSNDTLLYWHNWPLYDEVFFMQEIRTELVKRGLIEAPVPMNVRTVSTLQLIAIRLAKWWRQ